MKNFHPASPIPRRCSKKPCIPGSVHLKSMGSVHLKSMGSLHLKSMGSVHLKSIGTVPITIPDRSLYWTDLGTGLYTGPITVRNSQKGAFLKNEFFSRKGISQAT